MIEFAAVTTFLVLRILTGMFFMFSGYNKLMDKARHATLVKTLEKDGVPFVSFNQWFVPAVEFLGGFCVMIGFLTPVAALGLFGICLVATLVDGLDRIPAMYPINVIDKIDDVLYLPEVIYLAVLLLFITHGGGSISVDAAFTVPLIITLM